MTNHLTPEEHRKLDSLCGEIFRTAHLSSIREVSEAAGPLLAGKGDSNYREQVLTNLIIRYSSHPYTNSELKKIIKEFFASVKRESPE